MYLECWRCGEMMDEGLINDFGLCDGCEDEAVAFLRRREEIEEPLDIL